MDFKYAIETFTGATLAHNGMGELSGSRHSHTKSLYKAAIENIRSGGVIYDYQTKKHLKCRNGDPDIVFDREHEEIYYYVKEYENGDISGICIEFLDVNAPSLFDVWFWKKHPELLEGSNFALENGKLVFTGMIKTEKAYEVWYEKIETFLKNEEEAQEIEKARIKLENETYIAEKTKILKQACDLIQKECVHFLKNNHYNKTHFYTIVKGLLQTRKIDPRIEEFVIKVTENEESLYAFYKTFLIQDKDRLQLWNSWVFSFNIGKYSIRAEQRKFSLYNKEENNLITIDSE